MTKHAVSIPKLLSQIQTEHLLVKKAAVDCITHAIQCGKLIIALSFSCEHGTFQESLDRIGIPETTARRYRKVAEHAAKNPKKVKWLLEQGASLVDLYREFDLVKPCIGAGYDPETYQGRKARAQLELDFSYERDYVPMIEKVLRSAKVEELETGTLQKMRLEFLAAQQRIDALLKVRNTIDLQP